MTRLCGHRVWCRVFENVFEEMGSACLDGRGVHVSVARQRSTGASVGWSSQIILAINVISNAAR